MVKNRNLDSVGTENDYKQEKHRTKRLRKLLEIGTVIVSTSDFEKVLTRVVEVAVSITDAEEGMLFLVDQGTSELCLRAKKCLEQTHPQVLRQNVNDDIANLVLKANKAIRLDDEIKLATGRVSKSLLCVPLLSRGLISGVLYTYNFQTEKQFTQEDEYLLSTLADYGAIALEHARLLNHAERRAKVHHSLQTVRESLLSVYNLEKLLGKIAEKALRVLGANIVVLYEYDKETDDVKIPPIVRGEARALQALHEKGKVIPHKESVVFKIWHRNTPFYAPNAKEDWAREGFFASTSYERDEHFINREEIVSSVGVPLLAAGEALGVLFINFRHHQYFTADQKERIQLYANYAALAICNARIVSQIERHNKELSALYDTSKEIVEQALDAKSVLQAIVRRAVKLSNAQAGTVFLCDQAQKEVKVVITHNLNKLLDLRMKFGDGMAGRVAESGEPMIKNDYYNWEGRLALFEREGYRDLFKAVVQVPLKCRGEVLGVLAMYDTAPDRIFTQKDVQLLERFAGPAAIAIDNAKTFGYLQAVVKSSPDAIIAIDNEGIIKEFNEGAEHILGYKRDEISKKSVQDLYYGGREEAGRINHLLRDSKNGRVRDVETTVRGKDGENIPILFAGSLLRDTNREVIGSVGHLEDLREIRLLEERYHALYEVGKIAVEITESNMEEICQAIVNVLTKKTLHFKASFLRLVNNDGDLEIMATGELVKGSKRPESILKRGEGITSRILETKKAIYVKNIQQEKAFKYPEWARGNNLCSYLSNPLIVNGEVIGTLSVYTGEEYDFSREEMEFLEGFADLTALVIDKAKEVYRIAKIAETLLEVTPEAVGLGGESVYGDLLTRVDEIVSQRVPNTNLCLYICDDKDPRLAILTEGGPRALRSRLKSTWSVGEEPFKAGMNVDIGTYLCLEARSLQERLEGLLILEKTPTQEGVVNPFNEIDRLILTTLASAVGNALFQQRRQRDLNNR